MSNIYYTQHSWPFLKEFSAEDRQLAVKALARQEELERQAGEARARKAEELVEELDRQMHALLGGKNLSLLRQSIQRERLNFRDLLQPPEGLDRDYEEMRHASWHKIKALVHELGVKPKEIVRLQREFHDLLATVWPIPEGKVFPGYNLSKNLDQWTALSPLHKFSLPWGTVPPLTEDPNNPHRWFLFRPPFFGFLFKFIPQASSHFVVDRRLFLTPSVGLVGHEATMDCDDAGNFDAASAIAEAQIAFGFVPPVTGVVEVLIDAQSTVSGHHVDMEDEFGFSSAWCNQSNYLMMNVLHPNVPVPSLALMSRFSQSSGGSDLNESRQDLIRGQHYFAQLFSSGPVPAGESVVITAGTRTFDIARADDMKLHSSSDCQWFINSVEVRIAP